MHKNNAEASILLVRGNYFYEKKRVFEALLAYNNSLCFAEPLTNIAAICYGKRSVVYFDFKEYELCLANIELARQQNPTYEIGMLEDLKVECNKLLKTHNYEADENPMNFFKLSYPANVKLPCLADCLQLKVNKKFGRHIISTRDLKVGDVIAVTDFSFIFFNKRARLHHCSHCLESSTKLNLIPCTGCVQAMYCSNECMVMDKRKFHQFECGIDDNPEDKVLHYSPLKILIQILAQFDDNVDEMKKFLEVNTKPKSVFDFDLSNKDDPMYHKNMILATLPKNCDINGMEKVKINFLNTHHRFVMKHPKLRTMWLSSHKKFLDELLLKFFDVEFTDFKVRVSGFNEVDMNLKEEGYELIDKRSSTAAMAGSAVFGNFVADVNDPYLSLLNQSCYPNIVTKLVNNSHAWIVAHPVKAGEQLFIFRGPGIKYVTPRDERQEMIRECFGFQCNCNGCRKNWPPHSQMKRFDEIASAEEQLAMSTQNMQLKSPIDQHHSELYAEYFEYAQRIQAMWKFYPCWDIIFFEYQWIFIIYRLALPAKWFCRNKSD